MIHKIKLVAAREFRSVVRTRGFVIGILMIPIMLAVLVLVPRYLNQAAPITEGDVAVVDPIGDIAPTLVAGTDRPSLNPSQFPQNRSPVLRFVEHPAPVDLAKEKAWLAERRDDSARHIAVVVLHEDVMSPASDESAAPSYDLYLASTLEDTASELLHRRVSDAIVGARLRAESLVPARIAALEQVNWPLPVLVVGGDERPGSAAFQLALPYGLVAILLFGTMNVGGRLLGSTVEEKSSRVMEVLLSAVTPLELMAGKILGHMAVGAVVVGVYAALGSVVLSSMAFLGIVTPYLLACFIMFFLATSLLLAGLMGAAGAAVNDINDARSLLWPINFMMLVPWITAIPISRHPDAPFSVVLSFIPPMNGFAMLTRMTSASPPPAWQVILSIVISFVCAAGATWIGSKVFRVALLLQGKPPNFATLIRWVRAS